MFCYVLTRNLHPDPRLTSSSRVIHKESSHACNLVDDLCLLWREFIESCIDFRHITWFTCMKIPMKKVSTFSFLWWCTFWCFRHIVH